MFCSVLISGSAKSRMKRESGESPRQTGVSQKTCKTKSCLHSRGKDGKNVRNVELQLKFE